jgi:carbamoyltransferase
MGTDIEILAIGNCFLRKSDQPVELKRDYKDAFDLD